MRRKLRRDMFQGAAQSEAHNTAAPKSAGQQLNHIKKEEGRKFL